MLHIIDEAEHTVGCGAAPGVLFRVADTEEDPTSLCAVVDIALAGFRDVAGRALALPVKQCLIDEGHEHIDLKLLFHRHIHRADGTYFCTPRIKKSHARA